MSRSGHDYSIHSLLSSGSVNYITSDLEAQSEPSITFFLFDSCRSRSGTFFELPARMWQDMDTSGDADEEKDVVMMAHPLHPDKSLSIFGPSFDRIERGATRLVAHPKSEFPRHLKVSLVRHRGSDVYSMHGHDFDLFCEMSQDRHE